MPYRHAWLWILGLMAATVLAFWPSYFARLSEAAIAWHLHGAIASLWMALLAAQSWTIHHRQRALHRTLGLAVFAGVPLFIAGGLGVIQTMAQSTGSGLNPFYNIYGYRLTSYDCLATISFAYLAAMGLKERRNVQLHARYLLATATLLVGPVMGRITPGFVPGMTISGPDTLWLFAWHVHLSQVAVILFAGALYAANRRFGRPWLIVILVSLAQSVAFETIGRTGAWHKAMIWLGSIPAPLLFATGLAAGAVAVWIGWRARPGLGSRLAAA
jgi:hypothetical protein